MIYARQRSYQAPKATLLSAKQPLLFAAELWSHKDLLTQGKNFTSHQLPEDLADTSACMCVPTAGNLHTNRCRTFKHAIFMQSCAVCPKHAV